MKLRHAAWTSMLVLLNVACSDPGSGGSTGRGTGGSGQSGGSGGSGQGGSNSGGSGGSNAGGSTGSGGSTGGSSGTGGAGGAGGSGATGGMGTGGAGGFGGAGAGGAGAGGAGTGGAGTGGAGTGGAGTGGAGAGGAGTGGAGGAGTGGSGGMTDAGGKGGSAGSAGAGGSAGKDAGAGGGAVDASPPPPVDGGPAVPPPHGPCPDFVTGDVNFTPAVGGTRKVAITMGDASKSGGPLIVYWHSTSNDPTEATRTGGAVAKAAVAAAGGIIAAPYDPNYPPDQFPWLSHYTDHDALFDEILACAVQKTTISPARVHTLGFSAGGLMTTHLSFARSKYLASVACYSGGQQGNAQFQDMNNKFPTMILAGGTSDTYGTTNFYNLSQTWQTTLKNAGHFAMLCDHGGGHRLPNSTIVGGVFQFFMDHPYGTNPSPYAGGKIPSAISICKE